MCSLASQAHFSQQCSGRQLLGLRGQGVGPRQVTGAHTALDIVGELLQPLGLGVGLGQLRLGRSDLPCRFAQLTGQAQAGHLFGRQGLGRSGVRHACARCSLAGQPEGNSYADLGLAAAGVPMQAVVAMAQFQRRWRSPEAARSGAIRLGAAALAFALAGRNGALPCSVQRRAKGDAAGGGSGRRVGQGWEGGPGALR